MSGRPRDLELEKRLLAATWALLVERGYESLTMSEVASAAKAHRSDVYRRWSSKSQLVSDTLAEHLPPIMANDTGSLRSDLSAIVDDLALAWSSPWINGLVGWLADLRPDAEAEQASQAMLTRRSRPAREALNRAVERREISEIADLSTVANLLEGPLMHRRMFTGQDLTPDFLEAVVQAAHRYLTER